MYLYAPQSCLAEGVRVERLSRMFVKRAGFAGAYLAYKDRERRTKSSSAVCESSNGESDDDRHFVKKAVKLGDSEHGKAEHELNREAIRVRKSEERERDTEQSRTAAAWARERRTRRRYFRPSERQERVR